MIKGGERQSKEIDKTTQKLESKDNNITYSFNYLSYYLNRIIKLNTG